MKEQIKELRVKINRISQLVKELAKGKYIIPLSIVPDDTSLVKFITEFNSTNSNFLFINNTQEQTITRIERKELVNCYDSLILAKAWLGKVLGELGEKTPYKNDGNRKTVEDIEPTADRLGIEGELFNLVVTKLNSDENINLVKVDNWNLKTHIEKVDWLREEIGNIIEEYWSLNEDIEEIDTGLMCSPLLWLYYQHLSEARFWLGFELSRIRDAGSN